MSNIAIPNPDLPKRIKLSNRDYAVLGYYNANYGAKAGTKAKMNPGYIVLQEQGMEPIVTDYPIKRYVDTFYEEIYSTETPGN